MSKRLYLMFFSLVFYCFFIYFLFFEKSSTWYVMLKLKDTFSLHKRELFNEHLNQTCVCIWTFWAFKMKTMLIGVWYAFNTNVLDSENWNEAKLIRSDPIMISTGTSLDSNAWSALVICYPPYEHICGCFKILTFTISCVNVEFCLSRC
jgi:hypothetical protein